MMTQAADVAKDKASKTSMKAGVLAVLASLLIVVIVGQADESTSTASQRPAFGSRDDDIPRAGTGVVAGNGTDEEAETMAMGEAGNTSDEEIDEDSDKDRHMCQ
eukprot:s8751_g2.t1